MPRPTPFALLIACAMFGAAQLIPYQTAAPTAVNHAKEAALEAPSHIQTILDKACRNCHSNETVWPWYAKVAPVSWLIARDVNQARRAVNFSDWKADKPYAAMGALTAACASLQTKRMPPAPYRAMHPEARLSNSEVESFCQWTAGTAARPRQQPLARPRG